MIPLNLNSPYIIRLIKEALKEDIGRRDITTRYLGIGRKKVIGKIIAKESGILAGLPIVRSAFKIIDPKIKFLTRFKDGGKVQKDNVIAIIKGKAASLLKGERTTLNFLQHLSGIATLTNQFVKLVKGTKIKIYDTRKTIPLLRILEKYAVKVGGGQNNRFGLYDAVLIKDNHLRIGGGIKRAIENIRKQFNGKIEVETTNLKEVKEALESNADIIMLDNMNVKMIKKAVKIIKSNAIIEVSGGVNLKNIRKLAKFGVDRISIGNLTHSAKAIDFSLEIQKG